MYPLHKFSRSKLKAASHRALMVASTDYFSWAPGRQEKFRADLSEVVLCLLEPVLFSELLDRKITTSDVDELWPSLSSDELNVLNWGSLLCQGIGDDFIYLNESMAEGESLLNFETVFDFDYADHLFQREARKREANFEAIYDASSETNNPPEFDEYHALRFSRWLRLLIDNNFYYGNMMSLASYLTDDLDLMGQDLIDELIPHEFIEGRNHGKSEAKGIVWDLIPDAYGDEEELAELSSRWQKHLQQVWFDLSKTLAEGPVAVYMNKRDHLDEPHMDFIFSNAETLKNVRWRHFVKDCREMSVADSNNDDNSIESRRTEIQNEAAKWLRECHIEVMDSFKHKDPKVVKFRRRPKVLLSPDMLDSLLDDEPD